MFDNSRKTKDLVFETMKPKQAWNHVTEWFSWIYSEEPDSNTINTEFTARRTPPLQEWIPHLFHRCSFRVQTWINIQGPVLNTLISLIRKSEEIHMWLFFYLAFTAEISALYKREDYPDIGKEIWFWVAKLPTNIYFIHPL